MTDTPPKKALMPITQRMVKVGLQVLADHLDSTDPNQTDAQLVIAIYAEMWKVSGKKPKSLVEVKNTLLLPNQPRRH